MIEKRMTYDLLPNVDMKAYQEWAKKVIGIMSRQPGMLEIRGNRNVLGSPLARTTAVWRSLEDWARFAEGADRSWSVVAAFRKQTPNVVANRRAKRGEAF